MIPHIPGPPIPINSAPRSINEGLDVIRNRGIITIPITPPSVAEPRRPKPVSATRPQMIAPRIPPVFNATVNQKGWKPPSLKKVGYQNDVE
jgi:hypothetical protein